MKYLRTILFGLIFLLAACSTPQPTPTAFLTQTPTITPTRVLPTVEATTIQAPDPNLAAQAYLSAWTAEDYPAMYALLSAISREAISEADFTARYREVAAAAALSSWDTELLAWLVNPRSAQVSYRVTLNSVLVGNISRETSMDLTLENDEWRVKWDDSLILPELKGGNSLRMDYLVPARANIYDRNGHALVAQADAVAIGLNTSLVSVEEEGRLLSLLQQVTGLRSETIRPQLDNYRNYGWYLPIADISADQVAPYLDRLSSFPGVILQSFRSRYYFNAIAPHVTGYVTAIQAEEVEHYRRLGYNPYSDRVGQDGLERWGEQYLAGKRGGKLYVVAPDGGIINILAETSPEPASAIYTTIDSDLQEQAQTALNGFRGAIVVMERDTGRVLALASSPSFNPNLFEPNNYNSSEQIAEVFNPDTTPLLNRATQGLYPLGSVFKIITIAAALDSEVFTPSSSYTCGYFFTEIPGLTLNDWTYDHYLEDGRTPPSGELTLPEGLMKSCNPWFWHIGLTLFNQGLDTAVSAMARGFGLGSFTDIELFEQAGNIPDPVNQPDATNLAIGQGNTLVTPIQVADFVAAVGNGGTLYYPRVIEKIVPPTGDPTYVFTPTIRSTLPISDTYLTVIQDAMRTVIGSHGTARSVGIYLDSYNIPAAGKTGTAQSGGTQPHAWFAGYTYAGRADKPDIAVVVILENAGEGSEMAAPIFMGIVKLYFYGPPRNTFSWETSPGVLKTPTPSVTDTPAPVPQETPIPTP